MDGARISIGAALLLLSFYSSLPANAQGEPPPEAAARSNGGAPDGGAASPANKNEAAAPANKDDTSKDTAAESKSPAKAEAGAAKDAIAPKPAKEAIAAKPEPPPAKLACRAVRNDIGMYEPLRFMSITIDIPKKYVKVVHEGDGRIFEFTDGGTGNGRRPFVKITDDSITFGQPGHETWRIDRYTGTMTSTAFTIQFECQRRPAERKF